jgi:hypothetical protein
MGYPRILYQNRVPAATLTTTGGTVTVGHPLSLLTTWRDYYRFAASGANSYTIKIYNGSTALSYQSVAISGHNLFTCGARFKVEDCDDDSTWVERIAYTTPANDKTLALFFTQVSKKYVRLTIDNNGGANFSPEIGVLFIGNYLEFPEFITTPFDPDAHKINKSSAIGDTGRLLGTTVDFRGRNVSVTFSYLSSAWVLATWFPFWNAQYASPFIFCHDPENYAAAAYLMEFDVDAMNLPFINSAWRGPLTLVMRGLYEEG